jgi:hypothetical protein
MTTRTERWQEHLAALNQYINRTGSALVPSNHIEVYGGRNIALGAWVSYNRQRHRNGTLSAERTSTLSALTGWKWEKQQPGRRYDKARDANILERYKSGVSAKSLADEFGLSRQRVHQIVRRVAQSA